MTTAIDTGRSYLVPVRAKGDIVLLQSNQGEYMIPAFTDEARAAKMMAENMRLEPLSYERLKGFVIDDPQNLNGIVIDPFTDNIILNHSAIEEIDRLSLGMAVKRTDHQGELKLGRPAKYPPGMLQALENHLKMQECVREAWLLVLQSETEKTPHWALIMDFDGDRKTVFPPAAKTMQPFMQPGTNFELLKAEGVIGDHVKRKESSFYRRERAKKRISN